MTKKLEYLKKELSTIYEKMCYLIQRETNTLPCVTDESFAYFKTLNPNFNTPIGNFLHLILIPNDDEFDCKFSPSIAKRKLIRECLKNGLDVNSKDSKGNNFIQTAILENNHIVLINDLIKIAKEYGLNVNHKNNNGHTIIHTAISKPNFFESADEIINLINILGSEFDFVTEAPSIIALLESRINELENDKEQCDTLNQAINKVQCHMSNQSIIYIKTMINPLANNPETRDEFLEKMAILWDVNAIYDSFNLITNYPGKDEYDFSSITLEDLERILTTKLRNTTNIISEVKLFASRTFCALYYTGLEKQLLNFIQTGNEPTIINFSSLGDAINMPYPVSNNKTEKIKWLGNYLSYASKTKSDYMSNSLDRVSQYHMSPLTNLSIEEQLSNLNEELGRDNIVGNNNILSRKLTKK